MLRLPRPLTLQVVCLPNCSRSAAVAMAVTMAVTLWGGLGGSACAGTASAAWRAPSHRTNLRNAALEASFQAGMLCALKDRATGRHLVAIDPQDLPSQLVIFDVAPSDLDSCRVTTTAADDAVVTTFQLPNGNQWQLRWAIEKDRGDLILRMSSRTTKPVELIRYTLFGCDIVDHALVTINAYGASPSLRAPWRGVQIGDPQKDGIPQAYCPPLVALFEGEKTGWFVEGRDPRVGPANVLVKGAGKTVNLGMVRRFPILQQNPELYEIRIRAYRAHWEDAVDPFVRWMEKDAGFLPIERLPPPQAWVGDIETQAYIPVGNYDALEQLAKRLEPKRTFLGRQAEYRFYGFDVGYPDYRVSEGAKQWIRRARNLGFHVGVHFNSNGVGTEFPGLVERFKPGFAVIGKDAAGKDRYESIYDGRLIRCSPAFKPWREYLVAQMKDAVDAGVDVIYLDESMTCTGKYLVGGLDGIQGMMSLMRDVLDAYPHVAVETEQFNLLTAKYGKFALSQMPLGHPLSGYLFHRYVRVVPEGVMYSPTDSQLMDAFDGWGYMLPGASPTHEESWLQIAAAFHAYGLVPDARLPRKPLTTFANHWTGGIMPLDKEPVPPEGRTLFGLRGHHGVTACFEKHPTKRGLVIYDPGKPPQWVGMRHFNIRRWSGPGVPVYFGFRQQMRDWLVYDDSSVLGLDPQVTYVFDATVARSPTRFHVTQVPDDFIGYTDMGRRIAPQEVGRNDSFFRLSFAGHGPMSAYVPEQYDVYLDGRKLDVDRRTKTASAVIDASLPKTGSLGYFIALTPDGKPADAGSSGRPSTLLAFRRTDALLSGRWVDLPWQRSQDEAKVIATDAAGFTMNAGAFAIMLGKLPAARRIRLTGSYGVSVSTGAPGDGVVLLNGKQVLRVPAGAPPYAVRTFDADISSYAGQYVLLEILCDAEVRGATAIWRTPRIVVE